MSEKVFLNDKLMDIEKASIPVTDGGLLYGAGLFETMRSYNGKVPGLALHLERLFFSAGKLGLVHNFSKQFLTDSVYKTLRANKLENARLRLTVTCGPMTDEPEKAAPGLLITATRLKGYPEEYYREGVMVVLCPFRQNATDPLYGHKSLNYFTRMLALRLAQRKKAAEALWFTTDNRLAEGCISNVFLVKDSVLYTPRIDTPVLAGVVRQRVFDIASENSIVVRDKDLTINDCLDADEMFLTNSIIEILPVTRIEKETVGGGKVGKITQKVRQDYKKLVEEECGRQE